MCTAAIICYNKNMKRLITLLYIKIGGEKMYDENEGRKCSDDPKKTAKQAARKRMIMISNSCRFDHSRRMLYISWKNSSEAKSTTITTTTKKTETKQTSESSTKTKETQTSEENSKWFARATSSNRK